MWTYTRVEEVDCASDPSDEMGEHGVLRRDVGNRNRRLIFLD